jgi:hypothetical protein
MRRMTVYTVHEPPAWSARRLPDAERLVFVRDGFSFWAFLVAPVWMLWHRMWLVLAGYVVVVAALVAPMAIFGASRAAISVVGLFIALLVGLEASTLRRLTLRFRGWRNVGIVSGDDVEDAERRFFDAWLRQSSAPRTAGPPPLPGAGAAAPAALPRAPQPPDVIGLFPQPGARP